MMSADGSDGSELYCGRICSIGPSSGDHRSHGRERGFPRLVSPLESLWNGPKVPFRGLAARTWKAIFADRLFGHAAELGFYFLFALFPTLLCAGSILGLAARSAFSIYNKLLDYLAFVMPTAALGTVLGTFNETTAAATTGKITFGLIAAIWSASVGISAIQDTLNDVYKIEDSRSYFVAGIYAIGLTVALSLIVSMALASLLAGDYYARSLHHQIMDRPTAIAVSISLRVASWIVATALLSLSFAVIYYWAPDWRRRRWHWLTPGIAFAITGWLVASLGFRIYLHYFNSFTVTYGSLGAVIILLKWFYLTGLMILLGAEIDSQIEGVASETRLPVPETSTG